MRNAGVTLLLSFLVMLMLLPACSDEDSVVVEGDDVVYTGMLTVDSLSFAQCHHYWKGYLLQSTDSIGLLSSVPINKWEPDTIGLTTGTRIVIADIAALQTQHPDSIWLKVVTVSDSIPLQGWINEADLLHSARPTHFVARMLSPLGSMADVPGGRMPDGWLSFYFHPTANPWLLPWPMALVMIGLWGLLIYLLGKIDRLIFDRERYHCGNCGAPLRHLGICPKCGTHNDK